MFGLGCSDYQLWVYERGLRFDHGIGQLDASPGWTQLDWEIRLNGQSQATVTIANLSAASSTCRGVFGAIRKWRHELVVLRSDGAIWSGPIVHRQTQGGNGILTALLPDVWTTRRDLVLPHKHTDAGLDVVDLRDLYVEVWHDAILRDTVSNIAESYSTDLGYGVTISDPVGVTMPLYANTKVKANSDIQVDYNPMASDVISRLVDQGLDWVTWGRQTIVGAPFPDLASPQLLDLHLAVMPDVDDDGTLQTNRYGVQLQNQQGNGPPIYREAVDAGLQQRDGELVTIEQAQDITRPKEAAQLSQTRLATYGDQLPIIAGAQLRADAPHPISVLRPGNLVDVRLFQTGIPTSGIYRITRLYATVTAAAGEVLQLELVPIHAFDVEAG